MTDNEIIKALECCRDCKCKDCPCYNKETDGCKEIDEQDILDLINRQKAEIERLLIRNKTLSAITRNYDWKFEKAKSEAIKHFAHQLKILLETKAKLYSLSDKDCEFAIVQSTALKTVDNLVKEMVGDAE